MKLRLPLGKQRAERKKQEADIRELQDALSKRPKTVASAKGRPVCPVQIVDDEGRIVPSESRETDDAYRAAALAGDPEPGAELDLVESDLRVGGGGEYAADTAHAGEPETYSVTLGENTSRVVEALDNAARHGRRDPNTGRFTKHGGNDAA